MPLPTRRAQKVPTRINGRPIFTRLRMQLTFGCDTVRA